VIFEEDGDELADGLSSTGGRETSDLQLRRAQYEARFTGQDVLICRWLILEKLRKQIEVLQSAERELWTLSGSVIPYMETALEKLKGYRQLIERASTIDKLMIYEGWAAGAFYAAFRDIPMRWAPRDKKFVPEHWLTIGARLTGLMGKSGPRYATTPANAIRNMAFTVLANHVRVAAAVRGFDVACGWLHSDKEYRDNLVYDLMEPYRPDIDQKVIGLVTGTKFTYGDFVTTKEGQVRLHPALAKFVVATCVMPWTEIDLSPIERLLKTDP
jgi:CRISPR-associated endonuclease Cas1